MRRCVWPFAECLEAGRPVKAPCQIHHWMFLGTWPGSLMEPSPLRSGQSAQPFVRGVDVNAEWFLHRRQIPVAGNDRVTSGSQGRLNQSLILGIMTHPFCNWLPFNPQGRRCQGIQPRPGIRRERLLLFHSPLHRHCHLIW